MCVPEHLFKMIRGHWSRPSYSKVAGSGVRVNNNVGGAAAAAAAATEASSENVVNNDVVNDNVGDTVNANKDYVEMFERDDRLSAAAKKRHWLLTKLELEVKRKHIGKGNIFTLLYPDLNKDELKQLDVVKALRTCNFLPSDVLGVKLNDFRSNQAEIRVKDDYVLNLDKIESDLKASGLNVVVNKFDAAEEIIMLYGLPLTSDIEGMSEMIKETISPFVQNVGNIVPCVYGTKDGEFFSGKFNGNWRVRVIPKKHKQVPNFIVLGKDAKVMVKAKYIRYVSAKKEMCADCFSEDHFRLSSECPGPRKWDEYCSMFSDAWETHRLDTSDQDDQIISRNEEESRLIALSKSLVKDMETLESEKRTIESKLSDQQVLLQESMSNIQSLESENERLKNALELENRMNIDQYDDGSSNEDDGKSDISFDRRTVTGSSEEDSSDSDTDSVPDSEKRKNRLKSATKPHILSMDEDGTENPSENLEYDHDYIKDPLNVTVTEEGGNFVTKRYYSPNGNEPMLSDSIVAVLKKKSPNMSKDVLGKTIRIKIRNDKDDGFVDCLAKVNEKVSNEGYDHLYNVTELDSGGSVDIDLEQVLWLWNHPLKSPDKSDA